MKDNLIITFIKKSVTVRFIANRCYKKAMTGILSLCVMLTMTSTFDSFSQSIDKSKDEMILTSIKGDAIMFSLVSKSDTSVTANRSSDNKQFIIPLINLIQTDRDKIKNWTPTANSTVVEVKSIITPYKVFLALPFEKQEPLGICAGTSFLNIYKYLKPTVVINQRDFFSLYDSGKSGAGYSEMKVAARSLGYELNHYDMRYSNGYDKTKFENCYGIMIKQSLRDNMPLLVATDRHLLTIVGFDYTNPEKMIIQVWDQRDPKPNATDMKSIGVEDVTVREFETRYKDILVLKRIPQISETLENTSVTPYELGGGLVSLDRKDYINATLEVRIELELQQGHRAFIKLGKDKGYREILRKDSSTHLWDTVLNENGNKLPEKKGKSQLARILEDAEGIAYFSTSSNP